MSARSVVIFGAGLVTGAAIMLGASLASFAWPTIKDMWITGLRHMTWTVRGQRYRYHDPATPLQCIVTMDVHRICVGSAYVGDAEWDALVQRTADEQQTPVCGRCLYTDIVSHDPHNHHSGRKALQNDNNGGDESVTII